MSALVSKITQTKPFALQLLRRRTHGPKEVQSTPREALQYQHLQELFVQENVNVGVWLVALIKVHFPWGCAKISLKQLYSKKPRTGRKWSGLAVGVRAGFVVFNPQLVHAAQCAVVW